MQLIPSASRYKLLVNLYFLYIGLVAIAFGLTLPRVSRDWVIGDWLINYQGGFVRRGLPGQCAYFLGHLLHISPIAFIVVAYLVLYIVFILSFRRITLATSGNVWLLAILLSPAILAFPVLHPQAGFHKEVIYFAAFAFLLVMLRERLLSSVWVSAYISIALVLAVLSHESLVFFAPYFFAALVFSGRPVLQAFRECIIPFALALLVTWLCSRHLGSDQAALQVCQSLHAGITAKGNQICSSFGAITHLGFTRAMARDETLVVIHRFHYWHFYPWLAVLAFAPLVAESIVLARRGHASRISLLWLTAIVSIAGSIVLFIYAIDWGRWISIHVTSIALLLLFLDGKSAATDQERAPVILAPVDTRGRKFAAALALIAYVTLWSLPHFIKEPVRPGYLGFVRDALHHKGKKTRGS